jgi:hypothetical protein
MPNTFLPRAPRVLVLLTALSASVTWVHAQGYSNDPDCRAVSDAAAYGRDRVMGSIDGVARSTTAAVQRSKGCVDDLVTGALRTIPSFGGGAFVNSMVTNISRNLANEACAMLSNAQSQANRQLSSIPGGQAIGTVLNTPPVLSTPPVLQSPPISTPSKDGSLMERLSKMF